MLAAPLPPCIYRGPPAEGKTVGDLQVYDCQQHGHCVATHVDNHPACDRCRQRLAPDAHDFATRWQDPLHILDRTRTRTDALRGILGGRAVFLACGGPSAKALPLEQLNRRGAWTLAVNNCGGDARYRPQAFTASDPPEKFSHCIWQDPAIMKIVPTQKLAGQKRGKLRRKRADGTFEPLPGGVTAMPNVWGVARRVWLKPDDTFFTETTAAWGNLNAGVEQTGEPKTVCTMLLGLRLLRYLGASRVYMIGVDFWMDPTYGYSFPQARTPDACRSNNEQFRTVNGWLCTMQNAGVFKRFGMEVFNCYEHSGLRAFPYAPFDAALADVCRGIEEGPDLAGWYEK